MKELLSAAAPWAVVCACNACTYCTRSAYKCQVWQPIWPLNKPPCSLGSARRPLRLRPSGATKYHFLLGRKARGSAIRRHLRLFIAAHPARKNIRRPIQLRWASVPKETTSSPSSSEMLSLKSIWQRDHGSNQPHFYGATS